MTEQSRVSEPSNCWQERNDPPYLTDKNWRKESRSVTHMQATSNTFCCHSGLSFANSKPCCVKGNTETKPMGFPGQRSRFELWAQGFYSGSGCEIHGGQNATVECRRMHACVAGCILLSEHIYVNRGCHSIHLVFQDVVCHFLPRAHKWSQASRLETPAVCLSLPLHFSAQTTSTRHRDCLSQVGSGVQTQVFALAQPALHRLSHLFSLLLKAPWGQIP